MGPLLANLLASSGCDPVDDKEGAIVVLGGGAGVPRYGFDEKRPVLAIGSSAHSLLAGQGAKPTILDHPKYARRLRALATDAGFLAGTGTWELGVYTNQLIETTNIPDHWQAALVTEEGWVLAATSKARSQVAILCRPDSVQSLKHNAGQRLVGASLAWLYNKILF